MWSPSTRPWLAALLTPWAALTYWFWFVCDDAYITFRYAWNLANGHGLVFNAGESPPVEGYSNFLWMVLAAALEVVGAPVDVLLPALSALCGALLLAKVFTVAHQRLGVSLQVAFAATLPLALSPAVVVWSTSGLATIPFTLCVFVLFEQLVLRDDEPPLTMIAVAGALCLIRTEGAAWLIVIAAIAFAVHWWTGHAGPARRLRVVLSAAGGMLLAYSLWRFTYYGTLVPNTALVKVGLGPQLVGRGARYVLLFALTTITPVLALVPAFISHRDHGLKGVAIVAMAIAFPAYSVLVGGDFMPFGRLLLPSLPFGALVLAMGLARMSTPSALVMGLALSILAALPAADVHLVPEGARAALHFRLSDRSFLSEYAKWNNMLGNTEGFMRRGKALAMIAEPGDAVVSGAVGAMGYFAPELWVWDQYGLVTKEVAYRPFHPGPLRESPGHDKKVEAEYFAKYAPRFLQARAVKGRSAAVHMKDSIYRWAVDPLVRDVYVPDYVEVDLQDGQRHFLLMIRRARIEEDPRSLWESFEDRRKRLHAELRDQEDSASEDDG